MQTGGLRRDPGLSMPNARDACRILIVKTSSMGDIIHCLPAVDDILAHVPGAEIHWLVEEAFGDIPRMNPGIAKVIPLAWRRWRRTVLLSTTRSQMAAFVLQLRRSRYDFIIDAQGLIKSGVMARFASGVRHGLEWEWPARILHHHCHPFPKHAHAVRRNRDLFAQVLGYTYGDRISYGLVVPAQSPSWVPDPPYGVCLHATARHEKQWSEEGWIDVAGWLVRRGLRPILPWGDRREGDRARRLAAIVPEAFVPPSMTLLEAAAVLARARVVVGVDTGLLHLGAATGVPTLGLFCASDPERNGIVASTPFRNLGGPGEPPTVDQVEHALAGLLDLRQGHETSSDDATSTCVNPDPRRWS